MQPDHITRSLIQCLLEGRDEGIEDLGDFTVADQRRQDRFVLRIVGMVDELLDRLGTGSW